MSEYLIQDDTLTGIADAIREKSGTTDPVAVSDMAEKIRAINSGGSGLPTVTMTDLIPEGTLSLVFDENELPHAMLMFPAPEGFSLTIGETYFVEIDGTEYKCVAWDASAFYSGGIGLGAEQYLTTGSFGSDYPFVFGYVPNISCMVAYNSTTDISITARIYKCSDDGKILSVDGGEYVLTDPPESSGGSGLPGVTATDDGKILQVVDGVWSVLSLADSAVAAYIDDYINSALGGDY